MWWTLIFHNVEEPVSAVSCLGCECRVEGSPGLWPSLSGQHMYIFLFYLFNYLLCHFYSFLAKFASEQGLIVGFVDYSLLWGERAKSFVLFLLRFMTFKIIMFQHVVLLSHVRLIMHQYSNLGVKRFWRNALFTFFYTS